MGRPSDAEERSLLTKDQACIEIPAPGPRAYKHPLLPWKGFGSPSAREERERAGTVHDIRVLTYNLFLRPPGVKNNDNDWKEERMADFAHLLMHYDVVCLQEVFGFLNTRKHRLIQQAREAGFLYHMATRAPSFFSTCVTDGGLLVLSRFPIVEQAAMQFSTSCLDDALAAKGALYAKISVGTDGQHACFHVVTTHTQATYFNRNDRDIQQTVNVRSQQFRELTVWVDGLLTKYWEPPEPVLLLGDLNVNARCDDGEYRDMVEILTGCQRGSGWVNDMSNTASSYVALRNTFCVIDLLKNNHGEHPVTFADVETVNGRTVPRETVLTHKDEVCTQQSLDYILQLVPCTSPDLSVERLFPRMEVIGDSAQVEEFFIEGRPYTQLSDHYGVSCSLRLVKDPPELEDNLPSLSQGPTVEDFH